MKHKILIIFFTFFLMLSLGSVGRVWACSCVANITTCERYSFTDLIFVGKVINIETTPIKDSNGKDLAWKKAKTTFEIVDNIFGATFKQVKITNAEATSCDIFFEKDKTYLIFAFGNIKNGFSTGQCAGNMEFSEADKTLNELRNLSKNIGGRLFGNIYESLIKRDVEYIGMRNVKIKISEIGGKRKIYNVITDKYGNYEINIPAGEYKVTPLIPQYAELGMFGEDSISIKDKGCSQKNISVENKAQVIGKVIDSQGKPVGNVNLELISTAEENPEPFGNESSYSEKDGSFTFYNVPAGDYTLSVNYSVESSEERPFPTIFYPNSKTLEKAKTLKIGLGKSINNLIFRLPSRLKLQKIFGKVVFPNGKPASNMTVNLQREDSDTSFSYTKTDKNGNFVLNGFWGESYNFGIDFYGENDDERHSFTIKKSVFKVDKNLKPFRVVLEKKEDK